MLPRRIIATAAVLSVLLAQASRSVAEGPGAEPETKSARQPASPDEKLLRDVALRQRSGVMLLGRSDKGKFQLFGTAFVISRERRLLATCAHVADCFFKYGSMRAVPAGQDESFKVERVWYHPGMSRYLGGHGDLSARTIDPRDGPVDSNGPDLAVVQFAEGGPAVSLVEWELGGPDELRDLDSRHVGKWGFGEDPTVWPPSPSGWLAQLGVGTVLRTPPSPAGDKPGPAAYPEIDVSIPLLPGDSGGPVFLPNGHVVAICSSITLSERSRESGPYRSTAQRIDGLNELVAFHKLGEPGDWDEGPPRSNHDWEPDPELGTFRKAVQLVREARLKLSQGDHGRAGECCNEAIHLAPTYSAAYAIRGLVRARYYETSGSAFTKDEKERQVDWGLDDVAKGIVLANRQGERGPTPMSVAYVEANLSRILLLVDKAELRRDPAFALKAVEVADRMLGWWVLNPSQRSMALAGRARARRFLGEFADARRDVDEAIRLGGDARILRQVLASLQSGSGSTKAATPNPKLSYAYVMRGYKCFQKEDYDQALEYYDLAIKLDPGNQTGYSNRGLSLEKAGRYERSRADFAKVVELEPESSQSYNSLAWLLATCPEPGCRDGKAAIELATRACDLSGWKDAQCLDTLAAAYAEVGDFPAAIEWQRKALGFVPTPNQKVWNDFTSRRDLYKVGKPYRLEASTRAKRPPA